MTLLSLISNKTKKNNWSIRNIHFIE